MVGVIGHGAIGAVDDIGQALVAFTLFVTTFVLAVAVVGNDNL